MSLDIQNNQALATSTKNKYSVFPVGDTQPTDSSRVPNFSTAQPKSSNLRTSQSAQRLHTAEDHQTFGLHDSGVFRAGNNARQSARALCENLTRNNTSATQQNPQDGSYLEENSGMRNSGKRQSNL